MKIGDIDFTLIVATLSAWAFLWLLSLVGVPRCISAGLAIPVVILLVVFKLGYLNNVRTDDEGE